MLQGVSLPSVSAFGYCGSVDCNSRSRGRLKAQMVSPLSVGGDTTPVFTPSGVGAAKAPQVVPPGIGGALLW